MATLPVFDVVENVSQDSYRVGELDSVTGLQNSSSDQFGRRFREALKIKVAKSLA